LHYRRFFTIEALGTDADGTAVVAKMKELATDDASLFGKGSVRPDGRKLHDAYLFEVKAPEESRCPGDFYKLRAAEAFRPLKEGGCPSLATDCKGASGTTSFVCSGLFAAASFHAARNEPMSGLIRSGRVNGAM
jgi:hypothetical protein